MSRSRPSRLGVQALRRGRSPCAARLAVKFMRHKSGGPDAFAVPSSRSRTNTELPRFNTVEDKGYDRRAGQRGLGSVGFTRLCTVGVPRLDAWAAFAIRVSIASSEIRRTKSPLQYPCSPF